MNGPWRAGRRVPGDGVSGCTSTWSRPCGSSWGRSRPTRCGCAVSATRDGALIRTLLERVRACGPIRAILLCTDGLASYPSLALRLFRTSERTGRCRRPRLALPAGLLITQAITRCTQRHVASVEHWGVHGTRDA